MAPEIGGVQRRTFVEVCETQPPEVDPAGMGRDTEPGPGNPARSRYGGSSLAGRLRDDLWLAPKELGWDASA